MKLLRLIGLWGPVVAFMVLIYALSLPRRIPALPDGWDKLVHAAAYAAFGMLCLRAFHGGWRPLRALPSAGAMALTVAYGLVDELHQLRIPGREASLADWAADAAGAAIALLFLGALLSRQVWTDDGSRESGEP